MIDHDEAAEIRIRELEAELHALEIALGLSNTRIRELESVLRSEPSFAAVLARAFAAERDRDNALANWRFAVKKAERIEAERDAAIARVIDT